MSQLAESQEARVKPAGGAYGRYGMSLLLAISVVNYLDRQVVHILAEPIKHDLGLADWQLGMLTGLAFGLLYTVLGLPIARMAERGHRPRIIATAAAVWSVFTMVCGMAQNFLQLGLARVGVGVGEAGCTPPAHSLIMDYAPREKRSSALAFYGLGPPIGGLLGLAFGGLIADTYGWRAAFLVAGTPGLLFAVLAATTLREPRRALGRITAGDDHATLREMYELVKRKRSYWWLGAAMTLNVFIAYGHGPFAASFFLRVHKAELAALAEAVGAAVGVKLGPVGLLGLLLGLFSGIGGGLGTWVGGQVSDRFGPADPRRYLYLPALAVLVATPAFAAMLLVPSAGWALVFYGLYFLVSFTWYGPAFTAWFSLVPSHMRATNSAASLFVSNMLGLGVAPLAVGLLSDAFGRSLGAGEGLRWALMSLTVLGMITAWLFWRASRTFRAEIVG